MEDGARRADGAPPPAAAASAPVPAAAAAATAPAAATKRPDAPRPKRRLAMTTYAERLKWLKRSSGSKRGDRSAFRTALERRRAARARPHLVNANANSVSDVNATSVPIVNSNDAAVVAAAAPSGAPDRPRPGPSVTFKCRKCGRTTFASLEALKEHQPRCSAQAEDPAAAGARPARQVVLCSACGVYFESWNLYAHMREAHGRHICLFCLGLFSRSERLAGHLAAKHGVRERRFDAPRDLLEAAGEDPLPLLTCCRCEAAFRGDDDFATHDCRSPADLGPGRRRESAETPLHPAAFETEETFRDARPEKISRSALEQLIMEVKNCVAAPVEERPERPSPRPADVDDDAEPHDAKRENGPVEPDDGRPEEDCRVPKLTVKIPKETSDGDSSAHSSDGEDSDKLTVDLNAEADAPRSEVRENAEAEPEPEEAQDGELPIAGDDVPAIELTLDRPLDRYSLVELLKALLTASVYSCIYCNHARKIAVDGKQLGMHFISQHKFTATVDSITAEELLPDTIVAKIKSHLQDVERVYVNLVSREGPAAELKPYERTYECFQCYYVTAAHKDLYFHNRKMHQKNILLCTMCKSNFYTYGELVCHLCPGTYADGEISYECCLCYSNPIPSAFRLMVHLRKRHAACDVCLEICSDQMKLSVHVWKHKLHHLCYRCGIAYRNKPDITKHLFWKHGTESVLCKKCLQKKWPHVYHLCVPPSSFACEECNLTFSKAVHLKVHRRLHSGEYIHECKESGCIEKFISKKLLSKHGKKHEAAIIKIDDDKSDVEIVNDKVSPGEGSAAEPVAGKDDPNLPVVSKSKKSKRNKGLKDSKDLLIDVNLPELNLSESGSSDDSEPESQLPEAKPNNAVEKVLENDVTEEPRGENLDEAKPEPVAGIWDNFKLYQQSLEKPEDKPHIPKHVCDSDHDYCVIPTNDSPDVEIVGETKLKLNNSAKDSPKKKKASKKKNKIETISSSSDSSSDSDSTCSGGSNCSCCSSSGSSSSSSSSDSSVSGVLRTKKKIRKTSEVSHASAIDIMATEESPSQQMAKSEFSIPESDLETEESASDEEFYDEHPERIASKLLAEKRNQLMQLASSSPVNNGAPPEPDQVVKEEIETVVKKKVKVKKRKKEKRPEKPVENNLSINVDSHIIPPEKLNLPNKITISLQSNKMQVFDNAPSADYLKTTMAIMSDADSKRASKRRRVPNKFYGYSSDEEFAIKSHLPPKLEWRKEDLPSPVANHDTLEPLRIPEAPVMCVEPAITALQLTPKESSGDESDSSKEGVLQIVQTPVHQPAEASKVNDLPVPSAINSDAIPFPRPAGAREAREGESVYCYCRCPYDEVSEMIACDADGCTIEWFHFECVGIMVPPKGKWFCPDCRLRLDNVHK